MYLTKRLPSEALGIALINSLIIEFYEAYEGYPHLGVGWLLITHIAAQVLAGRPWERSLESE